MWRYSDGVGQAEGDCKDLPPHPSALIQYQESWHISECFLHLSESSQPPSAVGIDNPHFQVRELRLTGG